MEKEIALERYERYIIGENKHMKLNGTDAEKEAAARTILRYAITNMLGWTPKEASEHLTWDIIKQMRLDVVLSNQYITYPRDIDRVRDPDYAVYLAFPELGYDIRRQVLRVYRRVLNGEIDQFPKKLFSGARGQEKARILLRQAINNSIPADTVSELYERFANLTEGNRFLKKSKIYSAASKLYDTPLDYLHDSLPDEEKDEILYAMYQYRIAADFARQELRAKEKSGTPKKTRTAKKEAESAETPAEKPEGGSTEDS